ncbi:helix-turn-helix domain-containing protein [Amycolatopsis sp. GM8]|uniref:helix-turn-helix domain-containing protein n=1 Tax=Amycolatopsis sp. GM8 TaxID=2896530 RepID=UPI0035ABDECA
MVLTEQDASRLRQWRQSRGLTLRDVADLCGLDPTYLSRVERRQRELGPMQKVALARRLGVRISDLFDVEPVLDRAS